MLRLRARRLYRPDMLSLAEYRSADLRDGLFPTLQILRCLSGLGIFAAHWGEPYGATMVTQFQLTIDFFFFLEGFFAAQYLGVSGQHFFSQQTPLSRFARIYPLYFLALTVGAGSNLLAETPFSLANLFAVFTNGAIFHPTFSTLAHGAVFPLNPPSWAIVLEFWAFVVLWLVRKRLNAITLTVLWLLSVAAMLVFAVQWHDINMGWQTTHYWGGALRMMAGFSGGLLLARLLPFFNRLPRPHPLSVVAVAILVHYLRIRFVALPLLLIGVPAIVLAGAISRRLPLFDSIGRLARRDAYGIYLTHYPVMTLCHIAVLALAIPPSSSGSAIGFVATAAIVLIFAHLATTVIDAPIQRWLTRRQLASA